MVCHEYTHGMTERLVTDAQGFGALIGAQPGAIAEGTSDWYAMDYLVQSEPGLLPDGGGAGRRALRQVLQSTTRTTGSAVRYQGDRLPRCSRGRRSRAPACPGAAPGGYRYGDFGRIDSTGPELHADGEIWAQTLWRCGPRSSPRTAGRRA